MPIVTHLNPSDERLLQKLAHLAAVGLFEYVFRRAVFEHLASKQTDHAIRDSPREPSSCVTAISVSLSSFRSRITLTTSAFNFGSSALVISSHNNPRGSIASARAMATRCFCPPESWLGCFRLMVRHADALEQLAACVTASSRDLPPTHRRRLDHVFDHGQMREELEVLENHAEQSPNRVQAR